ncbi:MAG TPA: hypothetical protein VMT34_13120 [Aggregatilineales bacterium]|nr:hypothetical protein [Aggregatilineales bacterium]
MYALVTVALGDAYISVWHTKYQVMLRRPETHSRKYIQPNWAPYIQTPGFLEYPSTHSVASAAAADVLTRMVGVVAFRDSSPESHGMGARLFTSFEAAAHEAGFSQL